MTGPAQAPRPVQAGAPRAARDGRELWAIAASLTVVCAVGALVLGLTYMGTERAQKAAAARTERAALASLLDLQGGDRLLTIAQSYRPDARIVVYTLAPEGAGSSARTIAFDLAGRSVATLPAARAPEVPLGRLFVAYRGGHAAGFVIEGQTQGYKNRIRFLVGLDDSMRVSGVRVVEHEEDPGLGAEVARPWFDGQFIGRRADRPSAFAVAKDPMPEDWRAALETLERVPPAAWRRQNAARIAAQTERPLYAVTGATISSRALTDGVRATLAHFERRWELLEPRLEAQP